MSTDLVLSKELRGQLKELRAATLALHKTLLDYERKEYEREHARQTSAGELVRLAMFDPWFQWLRRLSEMIVRIDELLEQDEAQAPGSEGQAIVAQARELFRPNPGAEGEFETRYKAALLHAPAAVLEHMNVQKALFASN